jgi:protein gp37
MKIMAENSNIEWTHHTFNPWIGCQKVGPGCDHCYAEAWDARGLQRQETRWGAHAARTRTSPANWRKPLAWDKAAKAAGARHRVFCASLADVFDNHASILPEWRADLWALIRATPNLDWMLLTKRPGNIAKMLPEDWGRGYPNVWLGCTVVNQEEADRDVPKLLAVPAAVRFLSMEPLLGPVDLESAWHGDSALQSECWGDCGWCDAGYPPMHNCKKGRQSAAQLERERDGLDLVIVGGESGPGARPMHPDWARSLRDQCEAAGVAFHFKQWGEWSPCIGRPVTHRWRRDGSFEAYDGGATYPGEQGAARIGKKAAGRLLDGRTWDEMPEVRHA